MKNVYIIGRELEWDSDMAKKLLSQHRDMYAWSKKNKVTNFCPAYSEERAIEWLGSNAWHECDKSCVHAFAYALCTAVSCPRVD